MKKRITEYRKRVDRLLADEEEKTYEEIIFEIRPGLRGLDFSSTNV